MPTDIILNHEKEEQTPKVLELPIGTGASGKRTESDSLGKVEAPADHYWGVQTQRSLIHFLDRPRPHAEGGLSRVRVSAFSVHSHSTRDGHRICRQDVTLVIRSTGRGARRDFYSWKATIPLHHLLAREVRLLRSNAEFFKALSRRTYVTR